MRSHLISLVVAAGILAACGKDPAGTGPLAGDWQALASGETVTMTLTQSGQSIHGTGMIFDTTNATTLTITGTHSAPFVNLNFDAIGFIDWTFSGRLNGDSLSGVFNGSGFSNFGVVFVRQP